MTKADGAKGLAARLVQKAGLKHASSDQSAQSKDTKGTKFTRSKSDTPAPSNGFTANGRNRQRNSDELSDTECINTAILESSANYWPADALLPESGKLRLDDFSVIFKGTSGTTLTFNYADITIDKASRLGGMIHDAIKITIKNDSNAQEEYLFTTILKDRTFIYEKIQDAIADALVKRKIGEKVKEPPFQMPPDEILGKMRIIGEEKLKGVSMQVRM